MRVGVGGGGGWGRVIFWGKIGDGIIVGDGGDVVGDGEDFGDVFLGDFGCLVGGGLLVDGWIEVDLFEVGVEGEELFWGFGYGGFVDGFDGG